MDSGLEFRPYVVAYLDILGFKEFVEAAEKNTDKRMALGQLFNEVLPREVSTEHNNKSFPTGLELRCISVSDSIIISVPVDHNYAQHYPALIAVSIKAIQIGHALLEMGLLVRGAIAVGSVYRTDSNIVGTGYQTSVDGEKKAVHPQILLTESAIENLNDYLRKGGNGYSIFSRNEEGQAILDTIYPQHPAYWRNTSGEDFDSSRYDGETVKRFEMYRDTIISNLSHRDPRARGKWIWFARLFNANVRYFSQLRNHNLEIETGLGFTMNYLNPPEENSDWIEKLSRPGVKVTLNDPRCVE